MRLKDLTRYGLPEIVIEAWKKRQGDYLLPLQEKAVREGLLLHDKNDSPSNLIISAPTSAGKSFCGEMTAIGAMMQRRKVVMLLPLKSIAEEKFAYFKNCYQPIGIKTIIVTGDHPENDMDFERGGFDLALAIYEKFNRLLTVNPDILHQTGLIIVDELQMIGDATRGPSLETALIKVRAAAYSPRLIALSAVLHDESDLTGWLEARIIKETVRPVDLLQGIAGDGYFRFKSFNSGLEGEDNFSINADGDNLSESLIEYLKGDNSQKLVFLKSRRDTVEAAFRLAAVVGWKEAKTTLDALEGEEASFLVRSLGRVVSRGVAFHNADLTLRQRRAIEEGYRRGEIRVIFSTTTLAMGVNLPAETVLLETMKYCSGEHESRPHLSPITAAEFNNIAGRAGRFGIGRGDSPGRAVVLAGSRFEYEVLWSEYIDAGAGEKILSALGNSDLRDIILDCVVSGIVTDMDSLHEALSGSFYSMQKNNFDNGIAERAIDDLKSGGLLRDDFSPTMIGVATAASGISYKSCRYYMTHIEKNVPQTLIGWLLVAAGGHDFDITRVGLTSAELNNRTYEKILHRHFPDYLGEITACLGTEMGRRPLDYHQSALLKVSFLLIEWAEGVPVERLEQRYQLHLGQITDLAGTSAWLLASIAALIEADDCNSRSPRLLERYAFEVQFGINHRMYDLHAAAGSVLNRTDYTLLEKEGIISPEDLAGVDYDRLCQIIRPEGKVKNLMEKIEYLREEDSMAVNANCVNRIRDNFCRTSGPDGAIPFKPSFFELDGTYERERYLVKIDGIPVRLTGKSFKYLARLACSRLLGGDGWIYKDDIEAGFNQARYLYRLKQEVKRGGGLSWPIFENNRLGYYRLDLDPSKIRINIDNLKSHHDFEVRQMADELNPRLANC